MHEQPDFDDTYDPRAVMARVGHLPLQKRRQIERMSRIIRAAFGYCGAEMPERCRILSVALIGPLADAQCATAKIRCYDFRVVVSFPECAEETYWSFAKKIIASEFGERHPVTLAIEPAASGAAEDKGSGIVLYDASSDVALNSRELPSPCQPPRRE